MHSYARAMGRFLATAAEASPDGTRVKFPNPPQDKGPASYAGLAITLEPGRGSVDVWFPAAA